MLKMLLQIILVKLLVKIFTFSVFNLLKLNFSTTVFDTALLWVVFRVDTGNIRKIVENFRNC